MQIPLVMSLINDYFVYDLSEIDAIRVEHLNAADGIDDYLNNPVNAFRLIKRLHSDWETFEGSVTADSSRSSGLLSISISIFILCEM